MKATHPSRGQNLQYLLQMAPSGKWARKETVEMKPEVMENNGKGSTSLAANTDLINNLLLGPC